MSDQKICPTCGTEYPLSERFCPRDGTALRAQNAHGDLMGSIVAERYHILKKLGEGGMGQVYLAEHVKMGRKSALKVMNPGMNQDADAIARFNREAANASRLNHPNICAIYDFGETPDGLIYLAMEFIEGESLTSLIERCGALPGSRAGAIIHQAADALGIAHDAGIVHRDLKPDNIMIARGRDGTDLVKVVDFGIAKASSSDAQKVTKTGLVVGTPEYMSPEQLAGDKLDGRSDIYSLGLVAFNCLTGTLPFPSSSAQESMIMRLTDHPRTLAEMKPEVAWPDALQRVMDRALARDAAERYQNAPEFGREMARAVEDMPQTMLAEAGTQVMGAAAVPPTRVAAGGGAATQKVGAGIGGDAGDGGACRRCGSGGSAREKEPGHDDRAAVVVAAALGGGMMMLKGKEGTPETKPDSSAIAQGPNGSTPTPNTPSGSQPGSQPGAGSNPGSGIRQMNGKLSGGAEIPRKDPPPTGGPTPPDPEPVSRVIARVEKWAEDPDNYKGNASKALSEIKEALTRASKGAERGSLYALQAIFSMRTASVTLDARPRKRR